MTGRALLAYPEDATWSAVVGIRPRTRKACKPWAGCAPTNKRASFASSRGTINSRGRIRRFARSCCAASAGAPSSSDRTATQPSSETLNIQHRTFNIGGVAAWRRAGRVRQAGRDFALQADEGICHGTWMRCGGRSSREPPAVHHPRRRRAARFAGMVQFQPGRAGAAPARQGMGLFHFEPRMDGYPGHHPGMAAARLPVRCAARPTRPDSRPCFFHRGFGCK